MSAPEPTTREVLAEHIYERMQWRDVTARRAAEDANTGLTWALMPPWYVVSVRDRQPWLARADDLIAVLATLPEAVLDEVLAARTGLPGRGSVYEQRPA